MTIYADDKLRHEDLQLGFYETIMANIDSALDAAESDGLDIDSRLAVARGADPAPVSLERFEARNIHYGHRPSMILAPVDRYPSMSINVFMGSPATENSGADYGHSNLLRCAIEVIVKSDPLPPDPVQVDFDYDGQLLVGKRIKRTAEAIHAIQSANQGLGGYFLQPSAAPSVTYGDIFARDDESTGERYFWQGVRIEYQYIKQSVNGY